MLAIVNQSIGLGFYKKTIVLNVCARGVVTCWPCTYEHFVLEYTIVLNVCARGAVIFHVMIHERKQINKA